MYEADDGIWHASGSSLKKLELFHPFIEEFVKQALREIRANALFGRHLLEMRDN